MRWKSALAPAALLVTAFVATTWWALESAGVAVVETRGGGGTVRSTHVWYVEPNDELWLEAGTPHNGWFEDVLENPLLTFDANGRSTLYVARPVEDPAGHDRVRALIREKYGWRDRWVGIIVDTSESVGVRLVPVEEPR